MVLGLSRAAAIRSFNVRYGEFSATEMALRIEADGAQWLKLVYARCRVRCV
jgi:hypothetical protein